MVMSSARPSSGSGGVMLHAMWSSPFCSEGGRLSQFLRWYSSCTTLKSVFQTSWNSGLFDCSCCSSSWMRKWTEFPRLCGCCCRCCGCCCCCLDWRCCRCCCLCSRFGPLLPVVSSPLIRRITASTIDCMLTLLLVLLLSLYEL